MKEILKPNLFIVGHPKCGTSAMFDFLTQHKDIHRPDNKEPNYFCKELVHERHSNEKLRELFAPSYEGYQNLYENTGDEKYFVDATTHYLYFESSPKAIYEFNPNAKIIAVIRNPIDFLQSWHSELLWGFEEDEEDFEKALSLEEIRKEHGDLQHLYYTDWIKYPAQIKRYLDYFNKDNFKVILYEDFKKDNKKIIEEIFDFLDLEEDNSIVYGTHNQNKALRFGALKRFMQRPGVWYLMKKIPNPLFNIGKGIYHKIIIKNKKRNELSADFKLSLMNAHYNMVEKTNSILHENGLIDDSIDLVNYWGFNQVRKERDIIPAMGTKKLKILMFNRWVGFTEGGNETHIKELAVNLNEKGYKVDILTTGGESLEPVKEHINKIHIVPSPKGYLYEMTVVKRFLETVRYIYSSTKLLGKLIKEHNYDIITTHFSLEAFIMRFVRWLYNKPYVLIMVGDTDLELIEGKRADNASQLTHYAARECVVHGYYPEVLTKGVDQDRFNLDVDGSDVRSRYIKNENQFLVITVCRLEPRKNLETLIESARLLEKEHKNTYKFVIVGGGVDEEKLKNLVKKHKLEEVVYFTGMLPSTSDELTKHYAAADVFAMPTLHEGFGYVFTEAMAFGLPVIGTDTSSVPEVIEDVGIVVPIRSPKKLAEAIIKVHKNPKLKEKMIKKGFVRIEFLYWENMIGKYEKFLYTAIKRFKKRNSLIRRTLFFLWSFIADMPLLIYVLLVSQVLPIKREDPWAPIIRKRDY